MIARGSRYGTTQPFTPADDKRQAFGGLRARDIAPCRGVLEHTVVSGDRLDLLALHYYGDPGKWWRILDANPWLTNDGIFALESLVGTVLVIPPAEHSTSRGARYE